MSLLLSPNCAHPTMKGQEEVKKASAEGRETPRTVKLLIPRHVAVTAPSVLTDVGSYVLIRTDVGEVAADWGARLNLNRKD
jgi:hypothetical protein